MTNTTLKPKDLPCLFERFVEMCETKEKLKWCFASGEKPTNFFIISTIDCRTGQKL